MMRKGTPAADPDAYVAALTGWRRELVDLLRAAVRKQKALEERIKWGHLVYFANGPVLLIRAEESRVLFGFWRGAAEGRREIRDGDAGIARGRHDQARGGGEVGEGGGGVE